MDEWVGGWVGKTFSLTCFAAEGELVDLTDPFPLLGGLMSFHVVRVFDDCGWVGGWVVREGGGLSEVLDSMGGWVEEKEAV